MDGCIQGIPFFLLHKYIIQEEITTIEEASKKLKDMTEDFKKQLQIIDFYRNCRKIVLIEIKENEPFFAAGEAKITQNDYYFSTTLSANQIEFVFHVWIVSE